MTKKQIVLATVILLAFTLAAIAADVSGKWTYETPGRDGGPGRPASITLKADGANLTGTVSGGLGGRGMGGPGGPGGPGGGAPPAGAAPAGGGPGGPGGAAAEQPISKGKVDGDKISFEVTRETQMGSMTTKYEGVLAGSELKLKITRQGMDGTPTTTEVTAKKAN